MKRDVAQHGVPDPATDSFRWYDAGRKLMKEHRWNDAVRNFEKSLSLAVHFKTLELLGECFLELKMPKKAVIPLAAATTLNRGFRAPCLLAETFVALGMLSDAKDIVAIAAQRNPGSSRLKRLISQWKLEPHSN